jgi:ornithine cyclodeaminase/alanine dehydrogenase-like protein (mu-crystallin family)
VPATTRIVVYNGAEAKLQDTIAYLQGLFGVQVTTANDPTVGVDIIITTGRSTPTLTPPPLP